MKHYLLIFSLLSLIACGGYKLLPLTNESNIAGSYSSTQPCADCKEVRYNFDLRADHIFVMEETYVEDDDETSSYYHLGEWELGTDRLNLISDGKVKLALAQIDDNGFVSLSQEGQVTNPDSRFIKGRQSIFSDRSIPLEGFLSVKGDEMRFEECKTNQTFGLNLNSESAFLAEEYRFAVKNEGDEVFVQLIGQLPYGSKAIQVTNVMAITPGMGCR